MDNSIENENHELDIYEEMRMAIKSHRTEFRKTQEKLAEQMHISAQALRRYERAETQSLSFEAGICFLNVLPRYQRLNILFKMGILEKTDRLKLDQPQDEESYEPPTYDPSSRHLERLKEFYENTAYTLYYFDSRSGKTDLVSMILELNETIGSGYLSGKAIIKESYQYSCKLISPPTEHYTYIYLTAESANFEDRAVIIIPFNRRMHRKYMGGIGMMLSLSLEAKDPWPCFQKVAIVSNKVGCLSEEQLLAIHDKYLLLSTESVNENFHDVRKVYGDKLFDENSDFYYEHLKTVNTSEEKENSLDVDL